jgi:hypothetical protein
MPPGVLLVENNLSVMQLVIECVYSKHLGLHKRSENRRNDDKPLIS